jgi:hypothetical protein
MKIWQCLLLVSIFIAIPMLSACGPSEAELQRKQALDLLKARQEQVRQEEAQIASMTPDEVINIVLVYGVPSFPIPAAKAVGQWAAVYEGQGMWRIKGSVATGTTNLRYWSTTWSYNGKSVKLISYGF